MVYNQKMWFFTLLALVVMTGAQSSFFSTFLLAQTPQLTPNEPCPENLSYLRPEVERLVESVSAQKFRSTILSSLEASIPQAIRQADGIRNQIIFLRQEIVKQDQVVHTAEAIAREASDNPSDTLVPCQPGKKGSYCEAVELYYMASATRLTHQGFLDALECYKKQGVR